MSELLSIAWAIWLVVSIAVIYQFVGMHTMVSFFPEGRRSWMFPAQLASLGNFAACVLLNPWSN